MDHENGSPLLKPLYIAMLVCVAVFLIYTYFIKFDSYSETQLVQMSYIWVPVVTFCVAGLGNLKKDQPLAWAFGGAGVSLVALLAFFEVIWPLL